MDQLNFLRKYFNDYRNLTLFDNPKYSDFFTNISVWDPYPAIVNKKSTLLFCKSLDAFIKVSKL